MSILYFAWQCPNARIVCFEPNPQALSYLKKNVTTNALTSVEIHSCALGREAGTAALFYEPIVQASTGATLVPVEKNIREGYPTVSVPVRRLSEFVTASVDYLKLDVEGMEESVIQDLVDTGTIKFIGRLCLEYHFDPLHTRKSVDALVKKLAEEGFDSSVQPSPAGGTHSCIVQCVRT